MSLGLYEGIGDKYPAFGMLLLNDMSGERVEALEFKCVEDPDRMEVKILEEWLKGKGLPVTWESLVQVLRDIDLSFLADKIQASKIPALGKRGEREVCS